MITHTPFPYRHDEAELEGILVHDEQHAGPLPSILLIHEFTGLGEYMFPHADRLARQGFTVLLADMYGRGLRPTDRQEASRLSHIYRDDRLFMRARAQAGFFALAGSSLVDYSQIFCMGFSFGGCAALELARSGADIRGTVSFYGYLNTSHPCIPGSIRGDLLVLHGALDKVVPMTELPVFEKEMTDAGVNYQLEIYPDAGHGFANAQLTNDPATGSWYCEKTATQAWQTTMDFLIRT